MNEGTGNRVPTENWSPLEIPLEVETKDQVSGAGLWQKQELPGSGFHTLVPEPF